MKKILTLSILMIFAVVLAGCGKKEKENEDLVDEDTFKDSSNEEESDDEDSKETDDFDEDELYDNETNDNETNDNEIITKMVVCNSDKVPENADMVLDDVEIVFANGKWSEPAECEWSCKKCYLFNSAENSCEFQKIVRVDKDATDGGTGLTWEDAATDLTLVTMNGCAKQEIWVKKGVYHPTLCTSEYLKCESEKNYHFTMKKGLSIYGGFAGNEESLDERDPVLNETVLSGDFNNDDEWDETDKVWKNREDNALNVVLVYYNPDNRIDSGTIFDGFTIKGGEADDHLEAQTRGGGIELANHTPTIRNCNFIGNSGQNAGAICSGGAVSPLTIENSYFYRNTAVISGGAVELFDAVSSETALIVRDSVFKENQSSGSGSVVSSSKADVKIERSNFEDNIGNVTGALHVREANLSINSSTFARNKAISEESSNGGAIDFNTLNNPHILTISETNFDNNFAKGGAAISVPGENSEVEINNSSFKNHDKGALPKYRQIINAEKSTLTIVNSIFENNSFGAVKVSKSNLVIKSSSFINNGNLNGSGVIEADRTNVAVTGTFFINNKSNAGTFYISGENNQIYNSVFEENEAEIAGSAIFGAGGKIDIVSSSFSGNTDSMSASIALAQTEVNIKNSIVRDKIFSVYDEIPDDDGNPMILEPSTINIQNSNVADTVSGGLWNETCAPNSNCVNLGGNIDTDPAFAGTGDHPLMLESGSPCINTGDNGLIPLGIEKDILGNERIMGGTVDMGAYEFEE
ncbi:MAG: choice-of-anchor Q domain-containing protein [bacterium]